MKTISEFMELEHMNLHKQWDAFSVEENKEKAKELLATFSESLLKHVRLEDGALSPTFNRYLNIEKGTGPTGVMDDEHVTIIKLLDKVKEAFGSDSAEKLKYAKNHFERAMTKHHEREETTHYIFFDKVIAIKEWEDILNGEV